MANTINDRETDRDAQGGRRPRQAGKRPHKVEFRLTDEELSLLDDAARRSGRARGAFAAEPPWLPRGAAQQREVQRWPRLSGS